MIVIVAPALFVVSAREVAVTVTASPVGMADGAVKAVAKPAAVVTGLNDPQAAEAQLAVQITPALLGSLVTLAARVALLLIWSEAGADMANCTSSGGATIVRFKLLLCDGLPVNVAVMETVNPTGTADGAV